MNAEPPLWSLTVRDGLRKHPRSRELEGRIETVLAATAEPRAQHSLRGEHGRRVLEAVAARWNAAGFLTSTRTTWCKADGRRPQAMSLPELLTLAAIAAATAAILQAFMP